MSTEDPPLVVDGLSDPVDRTLFLRRVGERLAGLSEGRTLAVTALDLDRFSAITVARGASVREQVLVEVAHRLRDLPVPTDAVEWLADDVLVLAFEVADTLEPRQALSDRIMACFDEPFGSAEPPVHVSASVGVAFATGTGDDPQQLLAAAEVARTEARHGGERQMVILDHRARERVLREFELVQALHGAVERHELSLEYQPIMEMWSSRVVGFEALLRWIAPGWGSIEPAEFIPLAEESGLIVPIGSWVLDEVVRHWSGWVQENPSREPPAVTVNLSAVQLDAGFAGLADDLVAALAALPQRLSIEITESRLPVNPSDATEIVHWLKRLGVGVVIDDFGTGYSSLGYLREYPVDALKIDQSFVEHVHESDRDRAIVASVIDLAHALNILTVAEGVENEAQLNCLAELGCDYAQGFYIARPAPFEVARLAYENSAHSGGGPPHHTD
jgi:EAL domain-containing protein (putative c-di-GMP-specific phosphodiesterase class I)/GGDEF domain-containing protein